MRRAYDIGPTGTRIDDPSFTQRMPCLPDGLSALRVSCDLLKQAMFHNA